MRRRAASAHQLLAVIDVAPVIAGAHPEEGSRCWSCDRSRASCSFSSLLYSCALVYYCPVLHSMMSTRLPLQTEATRSRSFGREREPALALASALLALNIPFAIVKDDVVDGEDRHIEKGRRRLPVERRGPVGAECVATISLFISSSIH
jgi:hypothetical protein